MKAHKSVSFSKKIDNLDLWKTSLNIGFHPCFLRMRAMVNDLNSNVDETENSRSYDEDLELDGVGKRVPESLDKKPEPFSQLALE